MIVVACSACGSVAPDNPEQALDRPHGNRRCGGTFVHMGEEAARTLQESFRRIKVTIRKGT